MERVAIVSDTHIPDRERQIPGAFRDRIAAADHTIHAGDFRSKAIVTRMERLSGGSFTAVSGNADPRGIGLPDVATRRVEGVTFVVTHGHRHWRDRVDRLVALVREQADGNGVGVFGHTHQVENRTVDGVRVLNPGSVTGARPAGRPTMLTVTVDGAAITVSHHEL